MNVSIDYLLDDCKNIYKSVIKESIDLSKYEGSRKARKDKCVREKYPTAKIYPLLAKKKLTKGQRIFDNILGIIADAPFGTADVYNGLVDSDKKYYLAEYGDKQFLVLVSDDYIISRELAEKQRSAKFEIENIKFTKCTYEVKQ